MTSSRRAEVPGSEAPWDVPKARECLRCKDSFESEWSGERICSRCKGTTAWRNGTPLRSNSPGGGR